MKTLICLVALSVAAHFGLRIEGLVSGWAPQWACYFGWGTALSVVAATQHWDEEA